MAKPLSNDKNTSQTVQGDTEKLGSESAGKGKSISPSYKKGHLPRKPTSVTLNDTVFYDTSLSTSPSDVEDDSARDTSCPRGLMFNHTAEGKADSPRSLQDSAARPNYRGIPSSRPTSHITPITTRHMHPPSASYPSPSDNNTAGYSAGFQSPTLAFGNSQSPYNQLPDFRPFPQQPLNSDSPSTVYARPYNPSDMSHNLRTNYPHPFQFNGHSPGGAPSAPHPYSTQTYAHSHSPPHHTSPPQVPVGYPSPPSAFHPMNYSPPLPTPPYVYPTSQGYSPPHMFLQYQKPPYQPQFSPTISDADRGGIWWFNHQHAPTMSPQHFNGAYQDSYQAVYPRQPRGRHHSSASVPSVNHPASPTSLERRSSIGAGPSVSSNNRAAKPIVRRSYHPNPPSHRSEWVLWAGNVPSNAAHGELWSLFTGFPEADTSASSGVLSIFLISRSSCAFVNYDSEKRLTEAIAHFNGQPVRPNDPLCPKLVCRIRRRDDDLKAGVGGQRGFGIHMRWIKEQKARVGGASGDLVNQCLSADVVAEMSSLSVSGDNDSQFRRPRQSTNSSDSHASTTSSILGCFFPQRYFILKSLTQFDLDLSTKEGVWATQKHNEGILDQAYRTSQDVFLIFSVNKSGEFYGYARMTGPIRRGEHQVLWASRTSDSLPTSSSMGPNSKPGNKRHPSSTRVMDRYAFDSPLPMGNVNDSQNQESPPMSFPAVTNNVQSAPAEFGGARQQTSIQLPMLHSLGNVRYNVAPPPDEFMLDPKGPLRAMRTDSEELPSMVESGQAEEKALGEEETPDTGSEQENVVEKEGKTGERADWGESFKIGWVSTLRIPFQRTRHIRNPWNHDREVKVSRDGTELEPSIGRTLIKEWTLLAGTSQQGDVVGEAGAI